VPTVVIDMLSDPDTVKSQRAMQAVMQMIKIDIALVRRAYEAG
jgi:predicted 3-demethylubiquinone-9 3-methyltransferase (glyoxalase superfamily)